MNTGEGQAYQTLFGREHDLDTVTKMLRSPDCQLVTLTGPGGIGKTRLALQVAEQLRSDFDDEVHIIPLQALSTPQSLVTAVLEQFGARPQDSGESAEQLLRVLAQRPLLLVLDNFEHLLDASVLVARIMDGSPQIKLLLTSREVLNLQREWVWPMRGLAYPTPEEANDAYRFPAVRMFDSCGRRVNPSFSWQQELPALIEICALVEGSPLAIQLATGWLKSLSCQAILEELHDGINILSTRMRDVPEQHRSIRAVFDRSWKMLTVEEQAVLMRLCLFRDSFSRDAAQRVAETSLAVLADLIDKSLLHQDDTRRYFFHELFRQYINEHLRADSEVFSQAERAITHYYREFLAARVKDICGRRQQGAVREVALELQNIRSVMSQLAFTEDPTASRGAVYALSECLHMLGSYREAAAYARDISAQFQAMDESSHIDEHWHLLAETLSGLGWFYIRLGEFDAAEATIQRAQDVHERHDIQPIVGLGTDPRTALSELRLIQGDVATAETLSEAVYADSRDRDDPLNGSTALYILADVAMSRGDLDRAREQVREAVHLSRQAGNFWFLAYCLKSAGAHLP